MKTFLELSKNKKCDYSKLLKKKVAIISDSSEQYLASCIKWLGYDSGYNIEVLDTGYNQIESQILDVKSNLYLFSPQFVILHFSLEKLYEKYTACPIENRKQFAKEISNLIISYWEVINARIRTSIICFLFSEEDDEIFGNYSLKVESSFLYQLKKLNYLLIEYQKKNVYFIDINNLKLNAGKEFVKARDYYIGKIAISLNSLPIVSQRIINIIMSIDGKSKKCIICDLDNTIWGGIIGDVGTNHIEVGELGNGPIFTAIQRWLKELVNRGVLLAICSKNDENIAKDPFINNKDMILKLDDISMFVANWNDKPSNIKNIQKALNIGMDSIVFLDDNIFEREAVKSLIKEIYVPDLPNNPEDYLPYVKSLDLFETSSYSEEDKERTNQYKTEISRKNLEAIFDSYEEYLANLQMKIKSKQFDDYCVSRVSQLTQRSNQFNLRTIRYTESDIDSISKSPDKIGLYFELSDKFGDYGIISVVILEKRIDHLFINEWLMSCRVLKRSVEEYVMNKIVKVAIDNNYKRIVGEYIKTSKNSMVEHLYEDMGFVKTDETCFELDTNMYKDQNCFVEGE